MSKLIQRNAQEWTTSTEPKGRIAICPLPDWIRLKQAVEEYPIGRSSYYNLIKEGVIKSTTTKARPGQRFGSRLISRASIEAFLEKNATGGDAA